MDNETIEFLADDFNFLDPGSRTAEAGAVKKISRSKEILRLLFENKGSAAALAGIALIVFLAVTGPIFSGYRYDQQLPGHENLAPRIQVLEKLGIFNGRETARTSAGVIVINKYEKLVDSQGVYHWFGTDVLGRDMFTRVWEGTRISLFIAFVAVMIDMLFGLTYGMISGYFGGRVDLYMQRFVEILSGIPNLIIVTLLIIILKPGLLSIILSLMITGWISMSRLTRAQIIRLKEQEFVLAARTLGAGHLFMLFKELLPNIFGQLLIMSMFSIPNAIFTEAFLAFIGIGIPVPLASLGSIISDSFKSFTTHPYMIVFPVAVLGILMLSFNLLADGLRDALDPKMKEF